MIKILVVDDERSNVAEIADMIKKTGISAEVVVSMNPEEVLDLAKKTEFDAAFLDIQMPVINGLELAERLLTVQPQVQVVFVTAYNHYATEAFELHALDYLLKPVRFERLQKALDTIVAEKEQTASALGMVCLDLKVKLLQELELYCEGHLIKWNRQKTRELFCFLFLKKGKKVHKESICDVLWPELDTKRGLANLQVTMHRLKKDLSPVDKKQLRIEYYNHFYTLSASEDVSDLDEFGYFARKEDLLSLQKAFDLYQGELLADESWEWLAGYREELRMQYEQLSIRLSGMYEQANMIEKALTVCQKALSRGTINEEIAKRYLCWSDQTYSKSGVKRAWMELAKRYQEELNLEVPEEVEAVYKRLLKKNKR